MSALLYLTTNRASSAEPHQALAAQPGNGKLALADYYMGLGRTSDALAVVDELERSGDAQPGVGRQAAARCWYGGGRKKEAHQILDKLIQEKLRDAEVRVAKAHMAIADGAMADAVRHAGRHGPHEAQRALHARARLDGG